MNRGASAVVGAAVVVVVLALVLSFRGSANTPFDIESSSPNGYKALAILLRDQGVRVDSVAASDSEISELGDAASEAVVVATPNFLSGDEREMLLSAAERGATVVFAEDDLFLPTDDELKRAPAFSAPRGFCNIAVLEQMEAIDAWGIPISPGTDESCFNDGQGGYVTLAARGSGQLITISSPYLWVNARLQPNKEAGGEPLDNGPMAVALLEGHEKVTFVTAEPSPGVVPDGEQSPLDLLPFGVKLALAQAVGAFVLFAWWRSRRLGPVVAEQLPVEIESSELVRAMGSLIRRSGSTSAAGEILRSDFRRDLALGLGIAPDTDPATLATLAAARSSRDLSSQDFMFAVAGSPVSDSETLVRLAQHIDSIRLEVLDGHHVS